MRVHMYVRTLASLMKHVLDHAAACTSVAAALYQAALLLKFTSRLCAQVGLFEMTFELKWCTPSTVCY